MKYRFLALFGLLALSAGAVMQAQDYDDIYYDASKSASATTKVVKQSKTVSAYGEVPERYKVVANSNYRIERDEDEYNRRGAFEPTFEVDITGDTIYLDSAYVDDEAFANTRRIERFYNPDVVILSDDDDLVELYYDESPSVNLVVGTDLGLAASYGWASSYYPWYTGWYPYYTYYSPWNYGWYDYWSPYWNSAWSYHYWYRPTLWGWSHWGYRPSWYAYNWGWDYGHHGYPAYHHDNYRGHNTHFGPRDSKPRVGLASNRNPNGRVDRSGNNRNRGISTPAGTSRSGSGSSVRGGYATNRGGNISTNRSRAATSRSSSVGSRSGSSPSYSSGSVSRSSSSTSRSSSSYGGSRSSSSGSYSSGSSSRGSSGGYSGGGGGSRGGGGGSSSGSGRRH